MESWKDKKEYLCALAKAISDKYGGDDPEWFKGYLKELIDANRDSMDSAIRCFEGIALEQGINFLFKDGKPIKIEICKKCGFRPVFCLC